MQNITYQLALWSNVSPYQLGFLTCLGSIPAEIIRETAYLSPLLHARKMSWWRRAILVLHSQFHVLEQSCDAVGIHSRYAHNEWSLWYASCSSPTHNVDIAAISTLPIAAIELEMHGAAPFKLSTNIKISYTIENQNLLWTQHQGDNFCTILGKNWLLKKWHTKHTDTILFCTSITTGFSQVQYHYAQAKTLSSLTSKFNITLAN